MQNVQFDSETTEKPICATLIAIEISKASSAVYTWLWGRFESDGRLSATFLSRFEWKIWHESSFPCDFHDVISSQAPNCNFEARKSYQSLKWKIFNCNSAIATSAARKPFIRLDRRHKSFELSKFDKKRKMCDSISARFHNFFACLAPQRKFSSRQKWKP